MHHHITRAPAEAGPARPSRQAMAVALIAIGALAPAASVLARPAHDVGTAANEHAMTAARDFPFATAGAITLTNPLGRSRGPGAGAGLL